jgi:hypothetical protein
MPAMHAVPAENETTIEFDMTAGQTYLDGALVFLTGSPLKVSECGTDPAAILGVAKHPAAGRAELLATKQLVDIAGADKTFWMSGSTAPTTSHVGNKYGVVKDSDGIWTVDITDVTNTRLFVQAIDTRKNRFKVVFLAANVQAVP